MPPEAIAKVCRDCAAACVQPVNKATPAVSKMPVYRCPHPGVKFPPSSRRGTASVFRNASVYGLVLRLLVVVMSFFVTSCQDGRAVAGPASMVWLDYFAWQDGSRQYIQIARDRQAQYLRYEPDQKRVLEVKSGVFSQSETDRLFAIIEQPGFFEVRETVQGELLFFGGVLVQVTGQFNPGVHTAFASLPSFPEDFQTWMEQVESEISGLEPQKGSKYYVRSQMVEAGQARKVKEEGAYPFVAVDAATLRRQPFLREAADHPNQFVQIAPELEPQVLGYLGQSSGRDFFVSFPDAQVFQMTVYSMEDNHGSATSDVHERSPHGEGGPTAARVIDYVGYGAVPGAFVCRGWRTSGRQVQPLCFDAV